MKRILWDDRRGFTTAELLVAALFGMIVMATLYSFYTEQLYNLIAQETKTATLEDARGALDMMVRELRNAGSWSKSPYTAPSGCSRVVSATATSIRIQADLNGDGDCYNGAPETDTDETGEDVTYDLSSATSTCPAPGSIIRRNGNCLVAHVVRKPTESSPLFTYYKSNNSSFTPADTSADRDLIKRVQITFAIQVAEPTPAGKAAGRNITSTLSSSVEFRN